MNSWWLLLHALATDDLRSSCDDCRTSLRISRRLAGRSRRRGRMTESPTATSATSSTRWTWTGTPTSTEWWAGWWWCSSPSCSPCRRWGWPAGTCVSSSTSTTRGWDGWYDMYVDIYWIMNHLQTTELQKYLLEFDVDNDGLLDFEEFKLAIKFANDKMKEAKHRDKWGCVSGCDASWHVTCYSETWH